MFRSDFEHYNKSDFNHFKTPPKHAHLSPLAPIFKVINGQRQIIFFLIIWVEERKCSILVLLETSPAGKDAGGMLDLNTWWTWEETPESFLALESAPPFPECTIWLRFNGHEEWAEPTSEVSCKKTGVEPPW